MTCKLLAGSVMGHTSPLPIYSELFAIDIEVIDDTFLDIRKQFSSEIAILINKGEIKVDGQKILSGQLMALKFFRMWIAIG